MVCEQFNPVIFDLGSSTVRTGWAGHDQPKFVESSYMARRVADGSLDPMPIRFLNGSSNLKKNTELVDVVRAQEYSSEWTLQEDCLASLSDTLLYSSRGLQTNSFERPLLSTCPTDAPVNFKRKYFEHFMESAQVPAFFLGDTSVLALYASGRTSGILVDIGASATTIATVSKGSVVDSSTYAVGGDSIDQFISNRIDIDTSMIINTESFLENHKLAIVREIKHNSCKCSHHALLPVSPSAPSSRITRGTRKAPITSPSDAVMFKLPDGSEIDVSAVHEYAAESLFNSATNCDFPGLSSAILEKSPSDFILLTGGSAHIQGLHTRLVHEIDAKHGKDACTIFPFAQWTHRLHSSFIGASILASLSSFASFWVTPSSYLENGVDRLVITK